MSDPWPCFARYHWYGNKHTDSESREADSLEPGRYGFGKRAAHFAASGTDSVRQRPGSGCHVATKTSFVVAKDSVLFVERLLAHQPLDVELQTRLLPAGAGHPGNVPHDDGFSNRNQLALPLWFRAVLSNPDVSAGSNRSSDGLGRTERSGRSPAARPVVHVSRAAIRLALSMAGRFIPAVGEEQSQSADAGLARASRTNLPPQPQVAEPGDTIAVTASSFELIATEGWPS